MPTLPNVRGVRPRTNFLASTMSQMPEMGVVGSATAATALHTTIRDVLGSRQLSRSLSQQPRLLRQLYSRLRILLYWPLGVRLWAPQPSHCITILLSLRLSRHHVSNYVRRRCCLRCRLATP